MDNQSTHQPEPEPQAPSKQLGPRGWFFGALIFFLAYCLSVGPALKLTDAGVISERAFGICYSPVYLLCSRSDLARRLFFGYIGLWYGHDMMPTDSPI
jgi:hypothetical protein